MTNIAINGFGRIGRAAFKILLEIPGLNLVAINDLVPIENLAYLLKYDSVYGQYKKKVETLENNLLVDGKEYRVFNTKDPIDLPWNELGVDIVLECTGIFRKKDDMEKHLKAGAKFVILSAPAKNEGVATVVHGVNIVGGDENMISCASCTTNCITPIMEVMTRKFSIERAIMTTIHAYTSSQSIVDAPSKKIRRGRAAAVNFVPTSTGAAIATTKVLPSLKGKFNGVAVRGPIPAGSIADIVIVVGENTSTEEINKVFMEEAKTEKYKDIIGISDEPLVSNDILKRPEATIIDTEMTRVVDGKLVKIMAWYDNEWGFTCQMIREASRIGEILKDQ